ncbi:MAG: response regulator, partial [Bacteroidota bacterium]
MPKILILEDDTAFGQMLSRFLTKQNFAITTSTTLKEAVSQAKQTFFDIVLSDVRLPEGDGVHFLSLIKQESPGTQVIMMTGYAEVQNAVRAMKKGAFDYISKPFTPDEILRIIHEALKIKKDQKGTGDIKSSMQTANVSKTVVGQSDSSKQLEHYVKLVAPTHMSVLLKGASGTGKEVTARAIHNASPRKSKKFIAVDCGAIPK